MAVKIKLGAFSLDCADPARLAEFYSALTGWKVLVSNERFVALLNEELKIALTTHRVDEYEPPVWPGQAQLQQKQAHIDFAVDDLEAAQELALGAGATLADEQPDPEHHRVLLDPAGHPF